MTQFCSGNALRTKAVEYNEATFPSIHEDVPVTLNGQKGQYNERQCQEAVPDNLTKAVDERLHYQMYSAGTGGSGESVLYEQSRSQARALAGRKEPGILCLRMLWIWKFP